MDYKIWIENTYIIILMESARISFLPVSSFVNNITEPVVSWAIVEFLWLRATAEIQVVIQLIP